MTFTAEHTKRLLAAKGWKSVDLAARWNMSITWLSKLINAEDRAPHWDDAFRGLPDRHTVGVTRKARHIRNRKTTGLIARGDALFPNNRILVAIDNTFVEEGTRLFVVSTTKLKRKALAGADRRNTETASPMVMLSVIDDSSNVFTLDQDIIALHFADIGLDV